MIKMYLTFCLLLILGYNCLSQSTFDSDKSLPVYKSQYPNKRGGVAGIHIISPGFLVKTLHSPLRIKDVKTWVETVKRKGKLEKIPEVWKIEYYRETKFYGERKDISSKDLKSEIDKSFLTSDFIVVPYISENSIDYPVLDYNTNSCSLNDVEVSDIVLFPESGLEKFKMSYYEDIAFFYAAFPNASQEIVDQNIENLDKREHLDINVDEFILRYPNSKHRKKLIEYFFKSSSHLSDFTKAVISNLTPDEKNLAQVIVLQNNYFNSYDLNKFEIDFGKSAKHFDEAVFKAASYAYNCFLKPTDVVDKKFWKLDLDTIISLYPNVALSTDIRKFRIDICTDIRELIELKSGYYFSSLSNEFEDQMIKIITRKPSEYEAAKKSFNTSQMLKQLESTNSDIQHEVEKLKEKDLNEKTNTLSKAIIEKNYPLVMQYLNSGYSTKNLSFELYYFIAENSKTLVDAKILFSKIDKWKNDDYMLKLYPSFSAQIESKRFSELQLRATNGSWCYACCELYLSRYLNNPVKRKQVESWRISAHNAEVAIAERERQVARSSTSNQQSSSKSSYNSEVYANCVSVLSDDSNYRSGKESANDIVYDLNNTYINGKEMYGYKMYSPDEREREKPWGFWIRINKDSFEAKSSLETFSVGVQKVCKELASSGIFK